ncbi:response regulator transcription factor [Bacteroides sp. 519]|uniref:response regulator transcription factor n=1 Tax=Bacteroides sp. 519 TaxID=2302937 RepID=UPI0013D0E13D|nr:response regulator transcription factor [Bacteroides sp. 519]NDV57530.1 DNA-binding response regulator [Bacteroides sp. 519]
MIKLLLVEDNESLNYIIQTSLEDVIGGYEVKTALNGKEGLILWKEYKPDVIVADIDMPEMNGKDMVKKIREVDGDTLILFASGETKSITDALSIGGNNFIKKPYTPEELDAYLKTLITLKSGAPTRDKSQTRNLGSFTFDGVKNVLKDANDNVVSLTAKEAGVIRILILNKGEVVKRDAILEQVWGQEYDHFLSRSLDVVVNNLRKALASDPNVKLKTVKGIGLLLTD